MQLTLHPKQSQVFTSSAQQILFGGASGPGKSFLLRVAAIAWATGIPGLQIYLFRRAFPDLYRNHMEGPKSFPALLAPWIEANKVRINYSNHEISFCNGSKILLAHIQHDNDLMKIQGAEIHVALIDELTHFTKVQYAFIRSRVRMAGIKVPAQWRGHFPRIVTASNPGSIGHNWVKALFVEPAPPGEIWTAPSEEGGMTTQFIPAVLSDNPNLMEDDPDYMLRLQGLGNPMLVRAMLEGDWNVTQGGLLDDLWNIQTEPRLAITPFVIPASWRIYRAFDWGSTAPFSVGWWARSDGTQAPNGTIYPRGSVFRIGEWYGWANKPNEGIRMLAVDVGKGIIERERQMGIADRVYAGGADAAMWAAENGVCIADDVKKGGARFIPANKAPGSRKAGAEMVRKYLHAAIQTPWESPGMFIFNTCRQWIRTVPVLPRDEKDPDDAADSAEDHCLLGNTLVNTKDGEVPIRELVGTTGEVLTATGNYVPYEHCRLTRKKTALVRVVLEDGREIVCTPDHRFLTTEGEWRESRNLLGVQVCDIIRYAVITKEAYRASHRNQPHDSRISGRSLLPLRQILPTQRQTVARRRLDSAAWIAAEGVSRPSPG